mmetsp:Transcript_5600/g.8553  ORF Transcript_5600/g.8553 Transcript_5600/m.8553 type:complete len:219 (+) Transcript_5600:1768-2424(+)
MGVASADYKSQGMERDEVDEEDVATPGENHIEVRKCRSSPPENCASLNGTDPHSECEDHSKYSASLVIVGTRNRPRDVARNDRYEGSSVEARTRIPQLSGEEERGDCRHHRHKRSKHNADVTNLHSEAEGMEKMIPDRSRKHQSGIHGSTDISSERPPRAVVKPVVEVVEALRHQIFRRAKVEVGVKLVDHALVSQNGKETGRKCQDADEQQNNTLED